MDLLEFMPRHFLFSLPPKTFDSTQPFLPYNLSRLFRMLGFNLSLAKIEVGIAYAVWSAWGTILVTAVGIVFFRESCDLVKLSCLALIVAGVVGLNLR